MKLNGTMRRKELKAFIHYHQLYPISANMIPPPTLLPPFQKIPFTNEEAIGAINEASIGANKGVKPPPCVRFFGFRFYCFSNSVN